MGNKQTAHPRYVLVIEGNVHHAELLTELLDRHFAPVIIHTVDTFDDGLDFMTQSQYDLILTAGFAADAPITNYADDIVSQARGTPIIVITGSGDERLAASLTKRGISEYMVKTRETLEHLPRVLNKHISRRSRRPRGGKPPTAVKESPPTPTDVSREMDAIKEQVLRLSSAMRGWRKKGVPPDFSEIDKLREQLKHLRELVEKI